MKHTKKILGAVVATAILVPMVVSLLWDDYIDPKSDFKSSPFSGGVETSNTIRELKKLVPGYYDALDDDATGQDLFDQLRAIQATYLAGVGSYSDLWSTYKDAFIDKYDEKDGTILDIYSENPTGVDLYDFQPLVDQDRGHHSKESDAYNREHMIPQSIFGKNAKHIHNDAHFVFPTDATVNGDRANCPYDNVRDVTEIFGQGGKMGMSLKGEKSFEPINEFKGDVARATLYFVLTWKDTEWDQHKTVFLPFIGDAIGGLSDLFLKTYMEWSNADAVSQFDVDRNAAIAKDEGGIRNPFIDMPKLIDLIWGEAGRKES